MDNLIITNTTKTDSDFIFQLFDASVIYQEQRGYPTWKNYDRQAILRDIENRNQYKIIINDKIGIVFSVCYSDKVIWREHETGDSIYLHRIVINPEFKGKKFFGLIVEWSVQHCIEKKLKYVRMDTWAANPNIIAYYKTFGFQVIENYTTPDTDQLPIHNRKLELTLLQYNVDQKVSKGNPTLL